MTSLPRSAILPLTSKMDVLFTKVAHNSLATNKTVAFSFAIELEFGSVGFYGRRKTEPEEKLSEQG